MAACCSRPNERRVAEDRRDCYWLYVVTHCNTTPQLREPIRDPARLEWTEVTKVAHYRIDTQGLPGVGHDDASPVRGAAANHPGRNFLVPGRPRRRRMGKQELFTKQSPQKLKVLREHALIESAVSSNRIEGVEVDQARVGTIVFGKAAAARPRRGRSAAATAMLSS